MAIVELLCFLVCATVAYFSPSKSKRMIDWVCDHIPNRDWYFH